ncbi:LysM peptidoglycan-binding domain-containing C40 family peptidase [Arthrobacter sp. VKM Ac-2550]|uniref:LysM peptidoglycan-binding domain-containing C40 family peptidase n=1 Tax=Crystallibacter permensis TaxID=1938888 RepID=UPI002226BD3B|nr:LysM peptidoglycan-binding domain-containing C40 family peptidase [Arthrobacter sp. VKM Ac-2550]
MFKNNHARHRATPVRSNPFSGVSKAVSSHAGTVGRSAAVVTAAGGLMLGAGLPANAAAEVDSSNFAAQTQTETGAAPASAPASSEDAATHTVKAGDTLGAIASQHGVELNELFAVNGLDWTSIIYPGDVIELSGASQAPAAPAPAAPAETAPAENAPAPAEAPAQSAPKEEAFTVAAASANIEPAASTSSIADVAKSMVDSPYVYGGTSPSSGWDCSGFTKWVYAQAGIDLPRTSQQQIAAMTPTSNPQPGDLVSQNGGGHIGIYLGDGKMVSALNPGDGTLVHPISWMPVDGYYTVR